MKRSEALNLIKEIMFRTNMTLIDGVTHFESHANKYAEDDANEILTILEQDGIIDDSKFGSVCSRCKAKGWDDE